MTTVLIVDDEALAIQAIRRSINWKNLDVDRVLDAANGVEAQKILCQEPVQVLVCDLANCTGRAYSIHPTCAQPLEDAGKYARDPPRL